MPDAPAIVFVVDDDMSVRESLESLIRQAGWLAELFASGQEFLARPRLTVPCCLLLDVSLPGLSGLELQRQIAELEAKRTTIRTGAAGRWLTEAEREQVRLLTAALSTAWELRRLELARRPQRDHELVVVARLREPSV